MSAARAIPAEAVVTNRTSSAATMECAAAGDRIRINAGQPGAHKAGDSVRLQVTGCSGPSGSPGYNQRLLQQCANNIANALANLGVARSDISVNGHGENQPGAPAAGSVREPQNSRVEIVFA